jgi:hypothetical protein
MPSDTVPWAAQAARLKSKFYTDNVMLSGFLVIVFFFAQIQHESLTIACALCNVQCAYNDI